MSRNCPDSASVKSQGHGPPGASTFNIEPMHETDSDEPAEVLVSLPLGAIAFGDSERLTSVLPWPLDEWRQHYPYWNEPQILTRENIGNCYAMVIDSILTMEAPFPGDEQYDSSTLRPELRFYVHQDTITRDYSIDDRLTGIRHVVARCLVENEEFDISYWYAEQRARALRLTNRILHQRHMGDTISIVARKLLTDGIASSYPCTSFELDLSHRFWVQRSESDEESYIISDVDLEIDTCIAKAWLEEPTFDLVSQYFSLPHRFLQE
jgi:hypothetical protein